jgi:hypothetical protein
MSEFVRRLFASRPGLSDFAVTTLIVMGGVLMIGVSIYPIEFRPEWTSAQSLEELWPYYLAGAVTLALGWLVDRVEG